MYVYYKLYIGYYRFSMCILMRYECCLLSQKIMHIKINLYLSEFLGSIAEVPGCVHGVVGWEPHGIILEDTHFVDIVEHCNGLLYIS